MKTIQLVAALRSASLRSFDNKDYGKLSVKPIFTIDEQGVISNKDLLQFQDMCIRHYMFNDSKSLLVTGNVVLFTLEYHEEGVTSYVDKDEVSKLHTTSGWYVSKIVQALPADLRDGRDIIGEANVNDYSRDINTCIVTASMCARPSSSINLF
jgi:hypothetical protein